MQFGESRLIVDELIMDPENVDEAKALKKTWHQQEHAKTRNQLKAKLKDQIDKKKKLAIIKKTVGTTSQNQSQGRSKCLENAGRGLAAQS